MLFAETQKLDLRVGAADGASVGMSRIQEVASGGVQSANSKNPVLGSANMKPQKSQPSAGSGLATKLLFSVTVVETEFMSP